MMNKKNQNKIVFKKKSGGKEKTPSSKTINHFGKTPATVEKNANMKFTRRKNPRTTNHSLPFSSPLTNYYMFSGIWY